MIDYHRQEVTVDDFSRFLKWLVSEKEYTTSSIINVVDAPYKYRLEYQEFMIEDSA